MRWPRDWSSDVCSSDLFPDLNKAVKRDPRTNMRSASNNWDYWTLLPESLHQVTITMSDRGIPQSYRHMHGFSSHAYSFWNDRDRKSTRLNSSHVAISYAVFCLKKKNTK